MVVLRIPQSEYMDQTAVHSDRAGAGVVHASHSRDHAEEAAGARATVPIPGHLLVLPLEARLALVYISCSDHLSAFLAS